MSSHERILLPEAQGITGLSKRTLQQLSQRGLVDGAAKLGRRWTYDHKRLRKWVQEQERAVQVRQTYMSGMASITPEFKLAENHIDARLKQAIAERLNAVCKRG